MGNCVSSQSQAGVVEKQAATSRGRSIVAIRKAAMEKYPVPTKCRLVLNEGPGTTNNAPANSTQQGNDSGPGDTALIQLRSKLRPPSVSIARPISIQLNKGGIDSNGNIPRPSSLPRLLKSSETNTTAKFESLQTKPPLHSTGNALNKAQPPFRTVSLDSKSRTILNPPAPVASNKTTWTTAPSKDSQTGSISPSPSTLSIASSFGSNKSHSVADSGIATCSSGRSPTVSEKKSALSLKFGFYSKKPLSATEIKKATVDRINSANSALTAVPAPANKPRAPSELARGHAKLRPNSLRIATSTASPVSQRTAQPSKAQQQQQQEASNILAARMPTPKLTLIKHRAAQVLSRSKSTDYKSVELRPRLSVEAIVASLEQEMRHQLGPDPPPLVNPNTEKESSNPATDKVQVDVVERFGVEPVRAEVTFVDEEDEDFIEDIELQLQTPSSAAECHPSPEGDDHSRDEGHHGDEEDSAATSISDAMIDDEIADQPGLVMLGQSLSVPASPMHSWRSDLFHYNLPPMSMINYPPSEDDQSDASSYHHRLVRRRVASVSDIDDGLKDAAAAAAASSPVASDVRTATMRAELFNSPSSSSRHRDSWPPAEATIVIELEEYTAMANELADIKSQLITLQNLLVETVTDGHNGCGGIDGSAHSAQPLWDLKRDLVLLREELQEKNTTIKTLKNELRAAGGRTANKSKDSTASKVVSCNVATQTDRPRNGALANGLSPTENDEVQLVSFRIGQY